MQMHKHNTLKVSKSLWKQNSWWNFAVDVVHARESIGCKNGDKHLCIFLDIIANIGHNNLIYIVYLPLQKYNYVI